MADEELLKDAAKMLQNATAESEKTGKSIAFATDQLKKLGKAFSIMSNQSKAAYEQVRNASETANKSMQRAQDVLFNMGDQTISTGAKLHEMFDALVRLPMDSITEQIELQNEALEETFRSESKTYRKRSDIKKLQEDRLKDLQKELAKQEEIAKTTNIENKSAIESLQKKIKLRETQYLKNNSILETEKQSLLTNNENVKAIAKTTEKLKGTGKVLESLVGPAIKFLSKFTEAYDRFVQLDAAALSFRETTGLLISQMVQLEKAALNVNQELITQGVTIGKAYDAAAALTKEFSNAYSVTQDQIRAVAQLNANLGVTESVGAGFLQKMESVGGLTEKQSIGMAGLATNAAKAAGVPINKVMQDVANASGETLAMMRGNVRQMTLAAIQANRLGVDLQKSANAAKQLLSFTESVDAEMEASVLLGKNLNLNLARQLAFQGDIAGSQKEILRQVKSMGDFNKMNMFQQEALAKASGYTVEELSKMIKNEERLSKLKPEQLKAYEDATKALKEQKEETGEQILQQAQMQSAMQQLSNTYAAFKQILADILTPVVNVAVKILIPILKMVLAAFNLLLIPVKVLAKGIQAAFEPFEPVLQLASDFFDKSNAAIEKLVQGLVDYGKLVIKLVPGWSLMLAVIRGIGTAITAIGRGVSIIGAGLTTASRVASILFGALSPITRVIFGISSIIGSLINVVGRGIQMIGGLASTIGNSFKLVDIFVKPVIGAFNLISNLATRIISPIRGIISFFGTAGGMVGRLVSGLGAVGRVGRILGAFSKAVPVVGWIIAGLQGIVSMFTKLKSGTGFFKALGETLYEIFVEPFRMLFELLGKIPVIGGLFRAILPVFDALKSIIVGTFELIGSLFGTIWDITKGLMKGIYDIGAAIMSVIALPFKMLFAGFKLIWTLATDVFTSVKNLIMGVFKDLMGGNIMGAISKVFSFIPTLFAKMFSSVKSFMMNIFGMMFSTVAKVFDSIFSIPRKLIGGLINILAKPFVSIFNMAQSVYDKIASFFSGGGGLLSGIGSTISSIFGFIFSPLASIPKLLLGSIFSFVSSANQAISGLFDNVAGFFDSLIQNIIGSIVSVISVITEKVGSAITAIWSGIKSIASFIGGIFGFFGFGGDTPSIDDQSKPLENVPSPAPAPNVNGPADTQTVNMIAEIQKTNEKLDELIRLMANGGLVVNLDGRKVSEQLALASANV